ncbi:hypothetical protein P152DRAFT_471185 [Eremomyces bilateralis CBS 781.70]|uniref:Uncharacterized protein n=1 Tax=Eremomyces bilateralis CBS 781.70 TaxID=1392243 RepID=A0A6G1GD13_9PEZI|nr:uncharacterized protein P152DRAFT_471185 [Eremomyces bilateralis CBS 781.70]KAF1815796.1 hypothetical protein P152DRAFT_471185 [Eremomyces bilateralis CBS 781.70]
MVMDGPAFFVAPQIQAFGLPSNIRRYSRGSLSHSARPNGIEKSRSIQSSPRVLDKRRTTVSSKQYGGLEEHYRFIFGDDQGAITLHPAPRPASSRPLSWHPTTNLGHTPMQERPSAPGVYRQQQEFADQTAADYAVGVPNIASLTNENLGLLQRQGPAGSARDIDTWRQSCVPSEPLPYHGLRRHPHSAVETSSYRSRTWNHPSSKREPFTHPRSHPRIDCLPIQHLHSEAHISPHDRVEQKNQQDRTSSPHPSLSRKPSDELIGMGLYDAPNAVASLFSDLHSITGKGLKLAETFEPAPSSDGDDSEMADADADDNPADVENDATGSTASDSSVAELEQKATLTPDDAPWMSQMSMATMAQANTMARIGGGVSRMQKPQETALDPALQHLVAGEIPTNMSGQSFFFDEEDVVVTGDGGKVGVVGGEWWERDLRGWQPEGRQRGGDVIDVRRYGHWA